MNQTDLNISCVTGGCYADLAPLTRLTVATTPAVRLTKDNVSLKKRKEGEGRNAPQPQIVAVAGVFGNKAKISVSWTTIKCNTNPVVCVWEEEKNEPRNER